VTDPLGYIIDKWDLKHALMNDPPIIIPNTNRSILTKLFRELDYKRGAEIGTCRGTFARTIIYNNPECKLFCVDPWETYDGLEDWLDQVALKEHEQAAIVRLKEYPNVEIVREYSMNALEHFEDNSLDFVYIDANHSFPYVAEDVYYWSQKVRTGGIVSGHDYLTVCRKDGQVQVKEVVDAYTKAFKIKKWFVMDLGTAKRAGSFFWVKQ